MTEKGMAAPQGFEPRYADPESAVLPLNEGAVDSLSDERETGSMIGQLIFLIDAAVAGQLKCNH